MRQFENGEPRLQTEAANSAEGLQCAQAQGDSPAALRILMIAPTPYFADRGCHVRIFEEARALTELGHRVKIATYHLGRTMPGIPTRRTPTVPWYRKLSAGPSWHKPYLDLLLFFTSLSTARRLRPHIIHAHLHEGAFVGLLLKLFHRRPLVFDCQGSLTEELIDHGFIRRDSFLFSVFGFLERIISSRVDFTITSSTLGAEKLVKLSGGDGRKVLPLIDGVNAGEFKRLSRDESRNALGLPQEGTIAVFLGVLNRYQGVDLLLDAIKILRKRDCPIHFLVMGFPEEHYRTMAQEAGLEESVTFTGRVDYAKAPLYLCAGDIALSPKISPAEANGKLFNYMACGLPAVVFDTPVNREILGDLGIYADYGDAEDFAAKIEAISCDPHRRETLAAQLVERAVRVHSWQARATRLVELYRHLLSSASGNGR